ncbi:MAG: STAS domain-containing protein [Burkholderiales bacterium]|nr:STAS domain-containing protein [Burkholderiales bacterium]
MHRPRDTPATLLRSGPHALTLGGAWTARNVAPVDAQLGTLVVDGKAAVTVDARSITALDTAGAWVLYCRWCACAPGRAVTLQGLLANQARLLQVVAQHREDQARVPAKATPQPAPGLLEGLGRKTALLAASLRHAEFCGRGGAGFCGQPGPSITFALAPHSVQHPACRF